ncbi:MAG: hypothetical protein U9O94_09475, partial [Nanoarchaeota archaeon]|nr:hypothetical protein [Nanoarchaeota archaeon]
YVGNITSTFVLDDSDGYTIFDWSLTTAISGEVYASRASSINWSGINCSVANATHWENKELNHSREDNISATFNNTDNTAFSVGDISIIADSCPTTNLHVNDTYALNDDWEEVLLYDGNKGLNATWNMTSNEDFKNLVYAAIIEEDAYGYRGNADGNVYDFQMLLPENGDSSWVGSTAYYFWTELS